jgi:hypothetical protein
VGLVHSGSLALLHLVFPPSAVLLRIPALLSSLAAMGVAYALGRRFLGPAAAMSGLVLMACLPINIAYARLGWDPSHTGLLVLLATWAAVAGRRMASALLFAFALANHPGAVFAAPFLAFAFLGFELERSPWRGAVLSAAGLVGLLALAILFSMALSPGAGHYLDATRSIARLSDPSSWTGFVLMWGRLLSGETSFNFLSGQSFGRMLPIVDAAVLFVLGGLLLAGLASLVRKPHWPTAGLVAGWLAGLILLFVVAGSWALRPSLERFAIALVPATVLALASLLARCLPDGRHRFLAQGLPAAMGLALLAGFWSHYLQPLDRSEVRAGVGIRTGIPALNQRALDIITVHSGGKGALVIGEDWWIYWPLAYRGAGTPLAIVEAGKEQAEQGDFPSGTYWITYAGSAPDHALSLGGDARMIRSLRADDPGLGLHIWWRPR